MKVSCIFWIKCTIISRDLSKRKTEYLWISKWSASYLMDQTSFFLIQDISNHAHGSDFPDSKIGELGNLFSFTDPGWPLENPPPVATPKSPT